MKKATKKATKAAPKKATKKATKAAQSENVRFLDIMAVKLATRWAAGGPGVIEHLSDMSGKEAAYLSLRITDELSKLVKTNRATYEQMFALFQALEDAVS